MRNRQRSSASVSTSPHRPPDHVVCWPWCCARPPRRRGRPRGHRVGPGRRPPRRRRAAGAGERVACRLRIVEPIGAEGAPVVAVDVEREQVPPVAEVHEAVGLDEPVGHGAIVCRVPEAHPHRVAAGLREHAQRGGCGGVRRRRRPAPGHGHRAQRLGIAAEPLGSICITLPACGRPTRRRRPPPCALRRGGRARARPPLRRRAPAGAAPNRRRAGSPRRCPGRLHRVAEQAEAFDVAPQRARRHLEARREVVAAPITMVLQQREEPEGAGAGVGHVATMAHLPDGN